MVEILVEECICDDVHFRWGERVKTRVGRITYQWMGQVCISARDGDKG